MTKGNINKEIILILFLAVVSLLVSQSVLALEIPNPLRYKNLQELIDGILNFLLIIAIVITPPIIIFAAFTILTSAGDPGKLKQGWNIILYTVIGLAIMFLAKAIISGIRFLLKPFGG